MICSNKEDMSLGRPGKYFLIFSQLNDLLVLESDLNNKENVKVAKYIQGSQNDNQLWFYNSFQKRIFNKQTLMSLEADGYSLKLSKSTNNSNNNLTFDTSFLCKQGTNLVVELVDGSLVEMKPRSDNDNLLQMWKITNLPALYFFIKSRSKPNLVVDVRGDSKASGAKVILYEQKKELSDNQLWCEDERGRLRNKMNDFLIDINKNNEMEMNPYLSGNNSGWVVDQGCRIVNLANSNLVMSHKPGGLFTGGPKVVAITSNVSSNDTLWDFDFLPQQSISLSHVGLGKEFMIRNRGTGKTIDVKGDAVLNGSQLRLVFSNVLASKAPSRQLFYFDELTGTIRNCQRNFVIEATDSGLILANFDPYNKMQGWMYQDYKLINRSAITTLIQSDPQDDSLLSVGLDANLDTQHWELCHVPAKCFFIESLLCDKVVDVKGDNADAGAEVILYERKKPTSINQLWYEDEHGMLRSKLNGYVFDTSQEKVKLEPYKPQSMDQQWVIVGDRIENRYDNTMVIDIKGESKMNSASLIKYKFHGGENQRWRIIYQEDS